MKKITSQRIVFNLGEDVTIIDIITKILEENGLAESPQDYFNRRQKEEEPRLIIVRDAAISLFEKKAPEDVLVDLLGKHLKVSKESAGKIMEEIKEKLIPFAKTVEEKPEEEPKEVSPNELDKFIPYAKKVEIKNVEENAAANTKRAIEELQSWDEEIKKTKTVLPQTDQPPRTDPDPYKESIE